MELTKQEQVAHYAKDMRRNIIALLRAHDNIGKIRASLVHDLHLIEESLGYTDPDRQFANEQ